MSRYSEIRKACNEFNLTLRKNSKGAEAKYIFEKEPIKVGGNPTDIENKCLLTQEQHIKMVNWWNERIWEMRNR
ncbi:hypothetical protein AALG83_03715 [Christensenellaceae bacterium 44-20]